MARVQLERAGTSLATREVLSFQLSHAAARDAVHERLEIHAVRMECETRGWPVAVLRSRAKDRAEYLRRPDLGRRLAPETTPLLQTARSIDISIAIADGLSALAVHRHAVPLLDHLLPELKAVGWSWEPLAIVEQGRVAVADEIGHLLGAKLALILIGERPGLTSPDSLGAYLTWAPRPERTDAERNCISNIRPEGLDYAQAANRIFFLISEAFRRQLTGVALKEDRNVLLRDAGLPDD
jgi:ethanolamine ammonia-lyase small subunit